MERFEGEGQGARVPLLGVANATQVRVRPREREPGSAGGAAGGAATRGGLLHLEPSGWALVPLIVAVNVAQMLMQTQMPALQASWFTKCDSPGGNGTVVPCKPDYEAAQAVGGLVDSLSNLLCFFAAAFVGRLSDVVGRRPILVLNIAVTQLPTAALWLSGGSSPTAYYSAVVLAGLAGAGAAGNFVWVLYNAYVSDSYVAEERAAQFGKTQAAMTLAMIAAPLSGRLTDGLGLQRLCEVVLLTTGGAIAYVALVLPESLPTTRRNAFSWGRTLNPLAPLALLSQSRILRWTSLIAFLGACAQSGTSEIAFVYTDQVLGLEGSAASEYNRVLYCALGFTFLITNAVVLPCMLSCRLRASVLIAIGQAGAAAHLAVYVALAYMPYKAVSLSNTVPTSIQALSTVSITSIISTNMGAQEMGFALGTLSAVQGIADVLSPLCYSELFAYFGHRFHLPQVPFVLGVLFALTAAAIALLGPLRELEARKRRVLSTSHSVAYSPSASSRAERQAFTADAADDDDGQLDEGDLLGDDALLGSSPAPGSRDTAVGVRLPP
jgi:DHA1 family tetracycline resistance protein-like MFS transporter